jgi:hypothetical protein
MLGISIDPAKEETLMKGMAVLQKNRYQSVPELYASLYGQQTDAPAPAPAPAPVPSNIPPATAPPPVLEKAQENRPPVLKENRPPVSDKKPKKMTKEKWIIAIACGLVAGLLTIALGTCQNGNNGNADTPDALTGTWVGILEMGDDLHGTELMFDDRGRFYMVESLDDYEGFYVYEGTYTISDSRLQMTLLWAAFIADSLPNGYNIFDWTGISIETNINIDANTLQVDSLGFGMAYGIVLTRGVPSGLWSFEHRERLVNMPTPEVQSPRDTTHTATVTLGEFQELGGMPNQEGGWWSDSVGTSPYTAQDFTKPQYLILEFNRKPYGEIEFVWFGDSNDWVWTPTSFIPQGRIMIISLAQINDYSLYQQASSLKIFLTCYGDSWQDLIILDAYFANAR